MRWRVFLFLPLLLAAAALAAPPASPAAGKILSAGRDGAQIRSAPSFTGKILAVLAHGQAVTVLEERGSWLRVHEAGAEGWVHESDLARQRPAPVSGAGNVPARADARDVALAGKGFGADTERAYRSDRSGDDGRTWEQAYAQVEALLRINDPPEVLRAFLAAGQGGAR
jgi:uncharacterized protein YraI